jgi:molybdopterin/thiamine biosynthesis adenylyltransferase
MKMKIVFIGAGGINSWAIKHLNDTLHNTKIDFVDIYDEDVVEEKNIIGENQNFDVNDLLMLKAEVLGKRYNFIFYNEFITENNINNLDNSNIIILGVDNNKVRKLVYEYCVLKDKILIDLRAQGTMMGYVCIYKNRKDIQYYNNKYFNNEQLMEAKGSCQRNIDIENNHIENGNKAIAFIGIYCILLKILRNEELSTEEWKWVY